MVEEDPKTPLDQGLGGSKVSPSAPKRLPQAKDKETARQRKPPFVLPGGGGEGSGKMGNSKKMKDKSLSFREDRRDKSNK